MPNDSSGKKLVEIQVTLCRIESRLDSLLGIQGAGRQGPVLSEITPGVAEAVGDASIPKKKLSKAKHAATFSWKATDDYSSRRVPTPNRQAEIVFFGFMLEGIAAGSTEIDEIIWPEVEALGNGDISATPEHYYRPTGYRGSICVLGHYNYTAGLWNWISIGFTHTIDNPNARFSKTYDRLGNFVCAKWGWDPNHTFSTAGYQYDIQYSDCDNEFGVGFAFHPFR